MRSLGDLILFTHYLQSSSKKSNNRAFIPSETRKKSTKKITCTMAFHHQVESVWIDRDVTLQHAAFYAVMHLVKN